MCDLGARGVKGSWRDKVSTVIVFLFIFISTDNLTAIFEPIVKVMWDP
jgi:hypothetical protein